MTCQPITTNTIPTQPNGSATSSRQGTSRPAKSMSGQLSMFDLPIFSDFRSAISSPGSEDGLTLCASPDGTIIVRSGPAPVPASPSAPPVSKRAKRISDISGPSFDASSPSAVLQQSLENRLRANLAGVGSPEFDLTWKHWDLQSGPPILALRASGRRTSGNDCGGWPTPAHRDGEHCSGQAKRTGGRKSNLTDTVMLSAWPSPAARDWKGAPSSMESFERNDNARPLNEVARLAGWTTPQAHDTNPRGAGNRQNPKGGGACLAWDARLVGWPTPCSQDGPKGGPGQGSDRLPGAAALSSPAQTEKRGALDPAFSRWLMGYPPEWDACAATATRSSRKSRQSSSVQ
jgi:hypothetical protein